MSKRGAGGGAGTGQGSARKKTKDSAQDILLKANRFSPLSGGGDGEGEKRTKFPPIFTPVRDVGRLMKELHGAKLMPNFKLCSTGTRILCCNEKLFLGVQALLKEKKIEFYTHDIASTKPLKVVIRGLPAGERVDAIKDELQSEYKLKPLAVFEMSRQNKTINYRDSLYLVHLERGSVTLAELKTIKALAHIVVEWELYRPQHREVTQCKNCQAFGHGTKNCAMAPKCPKCAGPHPEEECELEEMDDEAVKCVNCGEKHLASDKSCPKRAEFIEIRKKASTRNQPNRNNRTKAPVLDEENFPDLLLNPLPRPIPNLKPLPLPGKSGGKPNPSSGGPGGKSNSGGDGAAGGSSGGAGGKANSGDGGGGAGPSTPPGWGNVNGDQKPNLYSGPELLVIIEVLAENLRKCQTRLQQSLVIARFVVQYGI